MDYILYGIRGKILPGEELKVNIIRDDFHPDTRIEALGENGFVGVPSDKLFDRIVDNMDKSVNIRLTVTGIKKENQYLVLFGLEK